ncbi:CmpA/NrtA family ABC transporter substrate-binding protein [Marivita hallyeonensis]|uniref:NitT/TauT family transport system ATP-binding protein n=1 Tax=Marivita hallyeonensis TaxID=996342 RepID=A0A1M5SF34_9RHOB|nr:CmpA/NrtA family ABC transporter substrate-binding protein [Marivita hallyeonensis]SHH37207.1 NitT/TauT family transport system ATP-binding protein [Marivita hallyeonensis]
MKTVTLPVAYMPLVDAAPLIVAQDLGFAEAEGLSLDLIAAPSWSSVRDMLAFGRVDAAHMLSPVPVAMALGLGGVRTALSAVSVTSVNGNVIGVGRPLEDKLRSAGHDFSFDDAAHAGAALASVIDDRLTVGVPFPFSMHVELLHYWFENTPLAGLDVTIRVVPPPLMAQAMAAGEIDAFCVGEPWGSVTVESGAGALLLPAKSIWAFAPEKVLAVRSDWAETEPHLLGRLMRATFKAGRWLSLPESRTAAATLLSRKEYLDVSSELIDRALSGRLTISSNGDQRQVDDLLEFNAGAANFPWRSQAKWIGARMAQRSGFDVGEAMRAAGSVFRSDLYRQELSQTTSDMPGASEKLEGSLAHATAVASETGRLILHPDRFFDGRIFDPSAKS